MGALVPRVGSPCDKTRAFSGKTRFYTGGNLADSPVFPGERGFPLRRSGFILVYLYI